jgi:hypothetical protein
MQILKFELTPDEYNFIRSVLGDLPTKSNAWVFLNNLEKQATAQVQAAQVQASQVQTAQEQPAAAPAAEAV